MIWIKNIDNVVRIESEAAVIATLVFHPDFYFQSEKLLPNHFSNETNRCIYAAIGKLVLEGVEKVDSLNIIAALDSMSGAHRYADQITQSQLNDFMENSEFIARHDIKDYMLCVSNVLDAAFRRDTLKVLSRCEKLCFNDSAKDIEQKIYNEIDRVMAEFSNADEIPQYKDVIEKYWDEIQNRQKDGYAGIPFKFPALNEYATIEKGELFIFGAEQKQGKSMMLLNCAVDLLQRGYSVMYIDSELNTRLFTARMLAHLSGITYRALTTGNYNSEEKQRIEDAIEFLKKSKFTHIYIPTFDQHTIYTAVKRIDHIQDLDVLIVDSERVHRCSNIPKKTH